MWQRWQSIGMRATSMRSFDQPCGSWQVAQFSRTGACSHRTGPRISVWQLTHSSATELPVLQLLHVADRSMRVVARRNRTSCPRAPACARLRAQSSRPAVGDTWRTASVSVGLDELLLDGLRNVHAVARRARQVAAFVRAPFPPGVIAAVMTRQARRVGLRGVLAVNRRMCPFPPSSTCACPAP